MSSLESQLRLSVEIAQCSPELRRYVHCLEARLREAGMRRLLEDLRKDEAQLDSSLPALLRPQA